MIQTRLFTWRLRSSLPLLLILGVTLLACGLYWRSLLNRQALQLQAAQQHSEWRANQLNEAVTQQLNATLLSIDVALKHLSSVYLHNPRDFDIAVQDVLTSYPTGMLQYVTVFDADGKLRYASSPLASKFLGQDFSDREHFSVHAHSGADALFVSAPIAGRLSDASLVQITRGIWNGGQFLGVIGIPVLPVYLSEQLVLLQVDPTDILAVVRLDGSTIARSHRLEEAMRSKLPPDRPFLQGKAGERGLFRSTSTYDKLPMLFSWQRLAQWPLVTVAAINEAAETAPLSLALEGERQRSLLAIGLAMAFSLGVALLMMRIQGQNRWLARSEAEQRAILNSEISGIVKLQNRKFVWMNQAFATMLGYSLDEMIGQSTRLLYPDETAFKDFSVAAYPKLVQGKVYRSEVQFVRKDGSLAWFDISGEQLDTDGRESIWSLVDITERKQIEDQVRHLAFHDSLTKLPNRRLLVDRMVQTMAASKRNGRYAALLFLDLDNFKPLNDAHGHDAGDLLLVEVAERLRQCVREMDTVARFGGDEFVVMLSDLDAEQASSQRQAAAIAEKIRLSLEKPYSLQIGHCQHPADLVTHRCSASIGVTLFLDHDNTEDEILNRADTAMYAAKHDGRNQVQFAASGGSAAAGA